jgi:hypothetical protein
MHNFDMNKTKVKWHYGNTGCGSLITFSAKMMYQANLSRGTSVPMFTKESQGGVHRHKYPYHVATSHST